MQPSISSRMRLTCYSRWRWLFLATFYVTVSPVMSGFRLEGPPGTLCPDGWTYFRDFNGGGLCVLPVNERKSWKETAEFCTNEYANLLKLDMVNQYIDNTGDVQKRIGDILVENGFQDVWTGMHVKDGRLMWHSYGPEYVKRTSYENLPWNWADLQPSTENGTCGILTLGTEMRERPDPQSGSSITEEVFVNLYDVALGDCLRRRQFVCQRPAIPDIVQETTPCEQGWVGNPSLPDCYTLIYAPGSLATYDAAARECEASGGELGRVSTSLDERIARTVNIYLLGNLDGEFQFEGTWVQTETKTEAGECQALSFEFGEDGLISQPKLLPCDKELPYICQKPYQFNRPESLSISTDYTDQSALLDREPFTPLPVTCMLSRAPVDGEVLFIETPGAIINSTNNWNNRLGFDIFTSNGNGSPYFFNITIPRVEVASRRKREIRTELQDGRLSAGGDNDHVLKRMKRQNLPRESEIIRTTGYYTCGFKSIIPSMYKETESVLVRYSESDMFVYIARMTTTEEFFKNDRLGTGPNAVTAFNLLKDDSYVDMLGELLGSVLFSFNVETEWSQDIHAYQAKLEKISGLVFQFRVLVVIQNSRNRQPRSSATLEQDVLKELQRYWTRRVSSEDFFDIKIKSTVMCPQEFISEIGRPRVRFPATNIGETANSEDYCYLGTMPVATSTCVGDYENGASWGPVAYTDNCYTGFGNMCPEGWIRFTDSFSSEHTCILPVSDDVSTWQDAKRYCRRAEGHLLKIDNIDQYFFRGPQQAFKYMGEYLFEEGLSEFWSSMNVEDGRLYWDGYGPEYVRRSKFNNSPWQWGEAQPSTENGRCGMVTLGSRNETRFDETETTETPTMVTVFDDRYIVDLSGCEERRKFVCERTPMSQELTYADKCEEGWVSNLFLSHCFKHFIGADEQETYAGAVRKCNSLGGRLVAMDMDNAIQIAQAVMEFFSINTEGDGEANIIWVYKPRNDTISEGVCTAYELFLSEVSSFEAVNEQCDARLSYICTKPAESVEPPEMKVESDYEDQDKLLDYRPFTPQPVSLTLSRRPLASEIIYIITPMGIFNSTVDGTKNLGYEVRKEYQDGVYTLSLFIPNQPRLPSKIPGFPSDLPTDLTNGLSNDIPSDLPNNFARSKREGNKQKRSIQASNRGVGFGERNDILNHGNQKRFKRQGEDIFPPLSGIPNSREISATVGEYSFGLRTIYPPGYIQSDPVLVRYSESDLYIYIAKLDINETYITPNRVSQEDLNSFSLLNDDSYLDYLAEYGDAPFLRGIDIRADWLDSLHTYRSVIERVGNRTLQVRVYVGITNSRILPLEFEQTVMQALQRYWRSQIEQNDFYENVRFRSTVACPLRKFARNIDDIEQFATFPVTRVGGKAYSWERCYKKGGALATAECVGGFWVGVRWGTVTFREGCEKAPEIPESDSTPDLKLLSELEIDKDNVLDIVKNTSLLTKPAVNLTEADIIYVADILYNYKQYGIVDEMAFEFVLETVDNILQTVYGLISKAQTIDNSANRIIRALDDISHLFKLITSPKKRFIKKYFLSEVLQQLPTADDLTVGISLANNESDKIDNESIIKSIKEGDDVMAGEIDVGIYIPVGLLKEEITRLTFQLFGKTDLFTTVGGRYKTNSKVAAARLSVQNEAVTEIEAGWMTAVFLPYENDDYLVCGYWDYSANEDEGGWGIDGCNLTREDDRIICKCNHLTNFAVLIDLEGHTIPDIHKQILSIITIVGLSVSIIGLGLTILGFLMFKHLRNGRGQQVLVMLSLSMLCSAIIFLVGMDKTDNRGGCIAVAVLLHYFILVSFMWMLVEGVLQYLRFVKVLGTYIPNFLIKSTIPAWGIPLIPIIVVLAIDYNMYFGGNGYCWLGFHAMLYAFLIPIGVIILANLIVFILVLCNLCKRRNKGMKVNQSERKMAFLHFQAALSIFVILGLTWVFGFLAIDDARLVFHYLFAILNAFQGFFIFLLFTAREKQIRAAWRKFCCGRKYKEKTSATHSGSDARTGRKTSQDTSGMTGSTGSGTKFSNIAYENGNH